MQMDGITPPTHFNTATHVLSDDAKFLHYIIPSGLKSTQMYFSVASQPKHIPNIC